MFRLPVNNNLTKLHRLAPQVAVLGRKEHGGVNLQQKRHAVFSNMINNFKAEYNIEAAKKKVNSNPNDENLTQYFRALSATKPQDVIKTIEKGWANGTVPITEPFLKQYFAAAARMGKLESVNISVLLALFARGSVAMPASAVGAPGALTEAELANLVRTSIAAVKSGGDGSGSYGSGAGSSSTNPIYVTNAFSGKKAIFDVLKFGVTVFIMVALFNSLTGDAGAPGGIPGAPGGGGGGLAAKMGMGSTVKKAEGSDKTFQVR